MKDELNCAGNGEKMVRSLLNMCAGFCAIAVLMLLVNCGGGGSGSNVPLRTFYVDSVSGNDVLDGQSTDTAWKSIAKVNEYSFQPGDAIKFKCGGVYKGGIEADWSGTAANPILIDAYGTGDLPVLEGSRRESGWDNFSGTIYRKSKTYTPGTTGAGVILQDGTPFKFKKWNTDAVTSLGSDTGVFTYDATSLNSSYLYIRCTDSADPDTHTIDAGFDLFAVHGDTRSDIHIKNIRFRNYSCHGVTMRDSSNIDIHNCHAENIGGAILSLFPLLYGGNGFEFTLDSQNCNVYDSSAAGIFDSGFSPQVFESNTTTKNVLFQNCTASGCGFAGIEISVLLYGGSNNEALQDIRVVGCTVTGSGAGWSGIRYGTEGHGIRIKADAGAGTITGVSITQSTVSGCAGSGIYIGGESGTVDISRSSISGNTINGISCEGLAGVFTMKVKLASSIIFNHTVQGIGYNVVDGSGFELVNNTFVNNKLGLYVGSCGGNAVLKNNIFYSGDNTHTYLYSGPDISAYPSFQSDYNCFYGHGGNIIGVGGSAYTTLIGASGFITEQSSDASSIESNPLFVSSSDFHLQSSSPCRNSGTSSGGVTADYEGTAYNAVPSRGAFK